MNFNFPHFITVHSFNGIKNINYSNPSLNLITINKTDYIFKKLSVDGNKGANSIILKIYSQIQISSIDDYDKLDDINPDKIIKILNKSFKKTNKSPRYYAAHKRFLNEVKALNICKENKSLNVIDIYESGECKINHKLYLYYTMEAADSDLKDFIENKHGNLGYEDKLKLCIELLEGLKELDSNNYYHRDIKPDNIFIVKDKWKIGDLGLVDGRELEYRIPETSKFIGPRGWISPEVMNKYLTEEKEFKNNFDCIIDTQSDIFQMGKLFWYIFQHNAPIGTVKYNDFDKEYKEVYPILKTMINYSKKKRFNTIDEIIVLFKKIQYNLLVN
jgi:serine/threonine protein kinase